MQNEPPSSPSEYADRYAELIVRYLDGDSSAADLASLQALMKSQPLCRELFVSISLQRCAITRMLKRISRQDDEADLRAVDHGRRAPILPAKAAGKFPAASRRYSPRGLGTRVRWMSTAAALAAVATGIALVVLRQGSRPNIASVPRFPNRIETPVATVSALAAAGWDGAAISAGDAMEAGRALSLRSGCAQLTFAGGAMVIVEAPARLTLDSPAALTLTEGRLSAIVSGGGFTVRTPAATVLDLGTDFGVSTAQSGSTDVEVFKGKVQASTRLGAAGGQSPLVLTEGQAAMVSLDAVTLDPNGAMPQRFIRGLSRASGVLDVVDLVAGGDGTRHRRGVGIDPLTGELVTRHPIGDFTGDGKYHHTVALPVVDGCFVPNGRSGPVQVDSIGDRFAFPVTSGMSFNRVWAGGAIPSRGRPLFTMLAGVDYAQPGHGLLFIHSNTGLTLDLAAIRRLHPGASLSNFHCVVGNSFVPLPEDGGAEPRAEAHVVVDGKQRFHRAGFSNKDRPFRINVPLAAADRFLTLATTDGGHRTKFNWVLWADPIIESTSDSGH
jgi:hypothetical protein